VTWSPAFAAVQGETDGLEAESKKTRAEINKYLRDEGWSGDERPQAKGISP
jgi:hypothetical protein